MLYREPEVSRMLAREHHERLAQEARRPRAGERARPEPVGAPSVPESMGVAVADAPRTRVLDVRELPRRRSTRPPARGYPSRSSSQACTSGTRCSISVRWPSSAVIRTSAPGIRAASQCPWATGTKRSCSPCQRSTGNRVSPRSKPQSRTNARSSSIHPSTPGLRPRPVESRRNSASPPVATSASASAARPRPRAGRRRRSPRAGPPVAAGRARARGDPERRRRTRRGCPGPCPRSSPGPRRPKGRGRPDRRRR